MHFLSDQAGNAEQQLGGIIQNHDHPVDSPVGGKQETAADHGIADKKQRSADGNQLALKHVAGKTAQGTGCHDAKYGSVDCKAGRAGR